MSIRRFVRESAFQLARRDLGLFLADHEEDILHIFREELERVDEEYPEENLFIDIKIVPLGEVVVRAVLRSLSRFLLEEVESQEEQG